VDNADRVDEHAFGLCIETEPLEPGPRGATSGKLSVVFLPCSQTPYAEMERGALAWAPLPRCVSIRPCRRGGTRGALHP
jgi:hypothetical protein